MNEKVSPEVLAAHAKMARERVFDTQEAAAKVIGCGRTTVLNWESEKDPKPIKNSQYQEAAARAYKVRLKWLIDGEGPDGYPLRETETNPDAAPTRPKTTDNDTLKGSLHELQGALTAIARVMAGTRLDVADALQVELKALPAGRYLEILLGVVEREHAKLKARSPKNPGSKAQGSKKHSRA